MSEDIVDLISSGAISLSDVFRHQAIAWLHPDASSLPHQYEIDPHYEEQVRYARQRLEQLYALTNDQWAAMAYQNYLDHQELASQLQRDWAPRLQRLEAALTQVKALQVDSILDRLKLRIIELLERGVADHQLSTLQSSETTFDVAAFKSHTLRHAQEILSRRQLEYDLHIRNVAQKNAILDALQRLPFD